jgi:hypothetical protein
LKHPIMRIARMAKKIGIRASAVAAVSMALASVAAAQADNVDIATMKQQLQSLQLQLKELDERQSIKGAVPKTESGTNEAPSFNAGPIKLTLGGFVELMGIYRSRNEATDWASNFNTAIPFPSGHNYDLSEFHLTERQSRISALAQGPADANYASEAYLEADFGGSTTNGNNNQSASFSPRVRHFYADYQNLNQNWYLLFGQTWSLLTASKVGLMPRQENIPLTIDGQYVPGFDWLRVAQVRLVKNVGNKLSLGVSAENPAAQVAASTTAPATANLYSNTVYNNPGASNAFASTTNVTTDYLPDVVAKVAFDPGWGHYEAFALSRWFRSRYVLIESEKNRYTHGEGIGGSVLLPLVPKRLDFQASFLSGTGVGRYGSTGEPDATINPADGRLDPLHGYQALAGLIWRPAAALTLFSYVGVEHVSARSYVVGAPSANYGYGYGSDLFNNSGCEVEGSSLCAANTSSIRSGTVGSWWKFYRGGLGNMQIGFTDTFIRREIFTGIGGAPATNINIAMLSFRYYPYQQ